MTHNFTPNGRSHRLLRCLAEGSCGFTSVVMAVHQGNLTVNRRKKLGRVIDLLQDEGFIGRAEREFFILPAGRDLLTRLDAESPDRTSVRVFAKVAA